METLIKITNENEFSGINKEIKEHKELNTTNPKSIFSTKIVFILNLEVKK